MIRWLTSRHMLSVLLMFGAGIASAAQELYIYPAKGQSAEQQEQDKYQCYGFAKSQTGFDPMAPPTATSAEPEQKGSVVGGAAKGAAAGAIIGAFTGSSQTTKKYAAYGAAGGGVLGGIRKNSSTKEQQQWQQQQQQQYQAQRDNYNRAYSACLEGRGYTVR